MSRSEHNPPIHRALFLFLFLPLPNAILSESGCALERTVCSRRGTLILHRSIGPARLCLSSRRGLQFAGFMNMSVRVLDGRRLLSRRLKCLLRRLRSRRLRVCTRPAARLCHTVGLWRGGLLEWRRRLSRRALDLRLVVDFACGCSGRSGHALEERAIWRCSLASSRLRAS